MRLERLGTARRRRLEGPAYEGGILRIRWSVGNPDAALTRRFLRFTSRIPYLAFGVVPFAGRAVTLAAKRSLPGGPDVEARALLPGGSIAFRPGPRARPRCSRGDPVSVVARLRLLNRLTCSGASMNASLLDEALEAWRDARQGVIDEVRNIPAEHFDFRPTPEQRSVREMVVHILEVAMMMVGELTREDPDFRRAPWPELLAMYARPAYDATTREALLALLASQLADGEGAFRACGELALLQFLTRFDGQPGTRFTWLHHGIAQEEYHRAQLAVYARLLGLVPALTQKITGG